MSLEYYITLHEARRYSIKNKKIVKLIKDVDKAGWEVALHPSRKCFKDTSRLTLEWEMLKTIIPQITGIRRHYLKGTYPEIWNQTALLGAKYDATCGYTRYPAFRNGTTRPYFAFDYKNQKELDVVETPLIIMDMTISASSEKEYIKKFTERQELSLQTGLLSVNWHNELFCNEIFEMKWMDIYISILKNWKNKGYSVESISTYVEKYSNYRNYIKQHIIYK